MTSQKTLLRRLSCLLVVVAVQGCTLQNLSAATIVQAGESDYRIIVPQKATSSLKAAAQELQKSVEFSTGARLPVAEENQSVVGRYISLGTTVQAAKAKLTTQGMTDEGFRIATRGDNIYILGPDTPVNGRTQFGGTSNGTANGVYTFLEDYLDARWLMPGELGRDVPKQTTWNVPDSINREEAPHFLNRRQDYMQNTLPAVKEWQSRQKQGFSFRIVHWHNVTPVVKPEFYDTNPEWFAMIDDKRPRPNPRADYKVETTNPDVVRLFADTALAAFKKDPQMGSYSISPSDGEHWSQSPESKALYDTNPHGRLSVTPLVLKFYHDVADEVAKKNPDAKLAGYIYASYFYPPTKGELKLPDNFYPVIAPAINYGYKLYRDDIRKDFTDAMTAWGKVTSNLFYYDLPNWYDKSAGIVSPAAPELLNLVFAEQVKHKVKGTYIYGNTSWSNFAMGNYVLAKMMWNPKLDARELQTQWLIRAYGEQAGRAMDVFYKDLDEKFRSYYRANDKASYRLTDEILKGLYGPAYPDMERLFQQAKVQPMTEVQAKRLQLIEDNLIVLQWRLLNLRALPANYQSTLRRTNEQVGNILLQENPAFELFPGMVSSGPAPAKARVQLAPAQSPLQQSEVSPVVRHDNVMLLLPPKDGTVKLTPQRADGAATFILYSIKTQDNKQVQTGILNPRTLISFEGKANTPYYFYTSSGITSFQVDGAAAAYQTNVSNAGLHLFAKKPTAFYYYVPSGMESWTLKLATQAPGETARVTLTAPDGQLATTLETGAKASETATLKGHSGFWKIAVNQAAKGSLDDVWLSFDPKLPQWVSIDPATPLMVTSVK